jgi:hypothetical protein
MEVNPGLAGRVGVDAASPPAATLPFELLPIVGRMFSSTIASTTSSTSFSSDAQTVISRPVILSRSLVSSLTRACDEREESMKRVGTMTRIIGSSTGSRTMSTYQLVT